MKSSITNRQMFFLLLLTLTTYSIISMPKEIAQSVGTGGWFPLMVSSLFFAAFVAVIVRLNSAFPGMMLFDYSQRIVGKGLAYALAVYFLLYFLLIASQLSTRLTEVLRAEFYPRTPQWVMLVASLIVIGCVAYRGPVSVGRYFEVIGIIFLVTAVSTHIVMLLQGNMNEIRPFFRGSQLWNYLLGVKDTVYSFLGIELLLIFPLSGKNVKRSVVTAFLTVLLIGLFYVLIVESSIMILGMQSVQNYNFALLEAVKQIQNPILERFDILFLTVGFAGLVTSICGVYLALVEFAARILKKAKRLALVAGFGIAVTGLSLAFQAIEPAMDVLETVLPVAGLASAFIIPAMLLSIAKVRGYVQKTQ